MKLATRLSFLLLLCLPLSSFAQEICGVWFFYGEAVIITHHGKTDTFYLPQQNPAGGGGGSFTGGGSSYTPPAPDTVYITRVETVYVAAPADSSLMNNQLANVEPPEAQLLASNDSAAGPTPEPSQADLKAEAKALEKELKAEAKALEKELKAEARDEKRQERKDARAERNKDKKNRQWLQKTGEVIGTGASYAAGAIVVAGGAVAGATVAAGKGLIEFGKILLRPFQKCDCGDAVANVSDEKAKDEKVNEVGKPISRHGRRVKDHSKPRKRRTRIRNSPPCGKVK